MIRSNTTTNNENDPQLENKEQKASDGSGSNGGSSSTSSDSSSSSSNTTTTSDGTKNDDKKRQQTLTEQSHQVGKYEQHNPNQDDQGNESNKPKRNPFCSRCRNHGRIAQVKGHKRHCEYRDCQCEGCGLVAARQIISARQIKRRRYQKQDEECGRQIEVSPPVLSREPNNDPAALIAKTLIGSANKHDIIGTASIISPALQKPPGATGLSPIVGNLHSHLPPAHQTIDSTITSMPVTTLATISAASSHHQHHHQQQLSSTSGQPIQNAHLGLTQSAQHSISSSRSPTGSALSNAFHLFHFPNSVLSAAAAASLGSRQTHNQHHASDPLRSLSKLSSSSSSSNNSSSSASTLVPSDRDQLSLVEEIHQTFGPLAIYAWLKAERFDFQKIRELIEISRASYNHLMDFKSICRIDLNNQLACTNSDSNNSRSSSDSSSDHHQPRQQDSNSKRLAPPVVTTTATGSLKIPSSVTSSLGSSPSYANGVSGSSYSCDNYLSGHISVPDGTHRGSISSLASSTLSQPFHGNNPHSLLWPSLNMTANGVTATVIHPHHLLPHFMQHHQLFAQQVHLQQQRLSPTSTLPNSVPSASSSSAVL